MKSVHISEFQHEIFNRTSWEALCVSPSPVVRPAHPWGHGTDKGVDDEGDDEIEETTKVEDDDVGDDEILSGKKDLLMVSNTSHLKIVGRYECAARVGGGAQGKAMPTIWGMKDERYKNYERFLGGSKLGWN